MKGQIEEMFNKVKDDEISLPEFIEWVGTIIDKSGEDQYSKGYSEGYSDGFDGGVEVNESHSENY